MPKKTTMNDLRDHLFETIEFLKDEEHPMDVPTAKVIADLGKTLIESANTEIDYMKLMDQQGRSANLDTQMFPKRTAEPRKSLPGYP